MTTRGGPPVHFTAVYPDLYAALQPRRTEQHPMKLTLRTNEDDWRELSTEGLGKWDRYAGHDVPEFVWLDLLRAAGVEVEVVIDDFGVTA